MRLEVDLVAVAAAIVIQQILGFLWFAVVLRCMGWTRRLAMARPMGNARPAVSVQLVSIACSAAAALALAVVMSSIGRLTVGAGALTGCLIGGGIAGSSMLMNATYDGRDKLATWSFILFQAISFSAMGAALAALQ